jgi:hypothetical protein
MSRLGAPILIQLQLPGGETNLFVKAVLQDQLGAAIAGSPSSLVSVGGGLYRPATFPLMPNVLEVTAAYTVWEDSGHTIPSSLYPGVQGQDVFPLEDTPPTGLMAQSELKEIVQGDDFVFQHQIVGDTELDGCNETVQPIYLNMGDTVNVVYQSQQPSDPSAPPVPPVTLPATPVGPYPTTRIQVVGSAVQSALLNIGKNQTARVEIIRVSGAKETHYLYNEYTVLARGFPSQSVVSLP